MSTSADNSGDATMPLLNDAQQAEARERIEKLVRLLEEDRVGYRLDRHLADEREQLAAVLGAETFSVAPARMTTQDLARRVTEYDAAVLPYVEYFAVGCAYGGSAAGPPLAEFLEGVATCADRPGGPSNEALRKAALYPALVLLYAGGTLSSARREWGAMRALLERPLLLRFEEPKPFVLHADAISVIPGEVQKALPGREREFTPLLNHLHERLGEVLSRHFLSPAHFDAAFTTFEVLFAAVYAHARQEHERALYGQASGRFWAPLGRLGWLQRDRGSAIDNVTREAAAQGGAWPPLAAGLFNGTPEIFSDIAQKLKAAAADHRGY